MKDKSSIFFVDTIVQKYEINRKIQYIARSCTSIIPILLLAVPACFFFGFINFDSKVILLSIIGPKKLLIYTGMKNYGKSFLPYQPWKLHTKLQKDPERKRGKMTLIQATFSIMDNQSERKIYSMMNEDCFFCEFFGLDAMTNVCAWKMLCDNIFFPEGGTILQLLWILCFLKVCPKQGVLFTILGGSRRAADKKSHQIILTIH